MAPARAHQQFDHCALEPMPRGLRIVRRRRRRRAQLGQESRDLGTAGAEAGVERVSVRLADEEPERLDERLIGRADDCLGAPVEDDRAVLRSFAAELAQKPCLACAGFAREQREAALAVHGPFEQGAQGGQLARAPDERERRVGHQRPGQRHAFVGREEPVACEVEDGVLREDLSLELLQGGARLDPELVERGARRAIRVERLGLPARAVQREHQLPAQALADADARRSASPTRRSSRRGGRARDPPRSVPRSPPAASPPGDRSRRARTPRRTRRAADRATAPGPPAIAGTLAAGLVFAASATRRSKRSTSTRSGSTWRT